MVLSRVRSTNSRSTCVFFLPFALAEAIPPHVSEMLEPGQIGDEICDASEPDGESSCLHLVDDSRSGVASGSGSISLGDDDSVRQEVPVHKEVAALLKMDKCHLIFTTGQVHETSQDWYPEMKTTIDDTTRVEHIDLSHEHIALRDVDVSHDMLKYYIGIMHMPGGSITTPQEREQLHVSNNAHQGGNEAEKVEERKGFEHECEDCGESYAFIDVKFASGTMTNVLTGDTVPLKALGVIHGSHYDHQNPNEDIDLAGFLCRPAGSRWPVFHTLACACLPQDSHDSAVGYESRFTGKVCDTVCENGLTNPICGTRRDRDGGGFVQVGSTGYPTETFADGNTKLTQDYFAGYTSLAKGTGKKVLILTMDWKKSDSQTPKISDEEYARLKDSLETNVMPYVQSELAAMSFGQTTIVYSAPVKLNFENTFAYMKDRASSIPFGLYEFAEQDYKTAAAVDSTLEPWDYYDLEIVLVPQVSEVDGMDWSTTKGVANVGRPGVICNGCWCTTNGDCSKIQDVWLHMVFLHELGHNFGLRHAASFSVKLDYGNPFDLMANFPDTEGIGHSAGNMIVMGWIPKENLIIIQDSVLGGVGDQKGSGLNINNLKLYQHANISALYSDGTIMGVQIGLKDNSFDIIISYKSEVEFPGVYVTWQIRRYEDASVGSILMDATCWDISQRDARVQPGWTYMDVGEQIVLEVHSINTDHAVIQVYAAPDSAEERGMIRNRANFTDGWFKCPNYCVDADILISTRYQGGCEQNKKTLCNPAKKHFVGGTEYKTQTDICPKTCQKCDNSSHSKSCTDVAYGAGIENPPSIWTFYKDSNGKFFCGGLNNQFCDTSVGMISLCPASCDACPADLVNLAYTTPSGKDWDDFSAEDKLLLQDLNTDSPDDTPPGGASEVGGFVASLVAVLHFMFAYVF